jgi:hypothetical protein
MQRWYWDSNSNMLVVNILQRPWSYHNPELVLSVSFCLVFGSKVAIFCHQRGYIAELFPFMNK